MKKANLVITGATEEVLNPTLINSCKRFKAICGLNDFENNPKLCSRPFDSSRNGFVLGEGAGIIILEELESAIKNNHKILGEIISFTQLSEGYHLVKPDPSGEGAFNTMKKCIENINLNNINNILINCHATSTIVGDNSELNAIKKLNKIINKNLFLSANKGSIGHCFSSAGIIENIFGIESMNNSIIPKNLNYNNKEIIDDNIIIPKKNYNNIAIDLIIKNSFGFGGINTSLIIKKFI